MAIIVEPPSTCHIYLKALFNLINNHVKGLLFTLTDDEKDWNHSNHLPCLLIFNTKCQEPLNFFQRLHIIMVMLILIKSLQPPHKSSLLFMKNVLSFEVSAVHKKSQAKWKVFKPTNSQYIMMSQQTPAFGQLRQGHNNCSASGVMTVKLLFSNSSSSSTPLQSMPPDLWSFYIKKNHSFIISMTCPKP